MIYNFDFKNIQRDINSSLSKINKGGLEESTSSLIDNLSLQNELTGLNQFSSAIGNIKEYSDVYDNFFNKIKDVLNSFKEKVIQRNSDNTSSEGDLNINSELSGLKKSLEDILNQKYKGEYIFSGDRTLTKPFENNLFKGSFNEVNLLTGSNNLDTKLINPSFLISSGKTILEDLDSILSSQNSSDLDVLDKWLSKIEMKHVSIGITASSVSLKEDYYSYLKISSEDFFKSKYIDLEGTISKYQDQVLQYQAMASAFEKTNKLSLVYYV